ncbi:MAG: hypothetical protein D4R39_00925 [Methylophilaceae bacterium]|nr:MAG: hypothetical protein D4R39_00925 [Methylophilaceae bacterium]
MNNNGKKKMQTSEQIDKIAPALLKAQMMMGSAVKEANNPFFKSKYADFSSVIEAVKDALNENDIFYIQGASGDGTLVSVETRLVHSSGQWFSSTATTPLAKNDAQGVGSAITYLKRYSLQAMCGVPSDDDDGNAASQPELKNKLPKLTDSEAKIAFESWTARKMDMVDAEGDIDNDKIAEEWGKMPSNVRSAIKRYGESLKIVSETDQQASDHMKGI